MFERILKGPSIKYVRIKEGGQPNADSCGQRERGVGEMRMSAF